MRVLKIEIEGFRGIANLEIAMDPQLNVFVGANGVGKTTILDATAILLDNYVARWLKGTSQSAERIRDSDLKAGVHSVKLGIVAEDEAGTTEWVLRKQDRYARIMKPSISELDGLNKLVRRRVEASGGEFTGAPLFIYYGQRRAVFDVPQRIRSASSQKPDAAFADALKLGDLNFREFVAWFRDRSLAEAQFWRADPGYRDVQLEAVRGAMTRATGLNNPTYRVGSPSGLCFEKGGVTLRVDQLSSGERSYLSLVGDLARRLAMLNEQIADPLYGQGIVLIDEVELHLHPIWQRKILPYLTSTFPNCQFIVTTHSPQVLGQVRADNIFALRCEDDGVHLATPLASYGRDSNYILLSILEGNERDVGAKEKIRSLDAAITEGRLQEADTLLQELRTNIEGAPPELSLFEARLERAKRRF